MFWFVFSFFKDVLRQASAVFPAMMYVWFWRFKETLSNLLDSFVFSNKFVLTYRCTNKSKYSTTVHMSRSWFFECKTLFRLWNWNFDKRHGLFWVWRGIREKSKRCFDFTLCL